MTRASRNEAGTTERDLRSRKTSLMKDWPVSSIGGRRRKPIPRAHPESDDYSSRRTRSTCGLPCGCPPIGAGPAAILIRI